MFSFRLWRIKRILIKTEGDLSILREWKNHRIRAIKENGQMQIVIHQHREGDNFWTYISYQLTEAGEMIKVREGKYPTSFVR